MFFVIKLVVLNYLYLVLFAVNANLETVLCCWYCLIDF